MGDEYVECTIKIPRACLEHSGKRYKPTGEFRPVKPGECAIGYWDNGAVGQFPTGCNRARIIVEEVKPAIPPKPEPFLVTNGNGYRWALKESLASFTDSDGGVVYQPAWRRVTPEELKALGLETQQ